MKITSCQKMNMKNGKYLIPVLCGGVILLVIRKKYINLFKSQMLDPTVFQYLNRLIEFYDFENLSNAQKDFLNLIDHGVSPFNAFDQIISKV